MVYTRSQMLDLCNALSKQEDLKVAVTESFKGATRTFACALLGGLLGGAPGLAIGSICGGTMAAVASRGKFKSVVTIIQEMSERDKEELLTKIYGILRNVEASDLLTLWSIVNGSPLLKSAILDVIKCTVQEIGYKLA